MKTKTELVMQINRMINDLHDQGKTNLYLEEVSMVVESLPENHPLFEWYESHLGSPAVDWIHEAIKSYANQPGMEDPQEFIDRLPTKLKC